MILTSAILASQILALHQDAEFPQHRQVLPNGAVTFVEAGEPNGIFSAAIHFGNANVSAEDRAAGAPHLWEHIGRKGARQNPRHATRIGRVCPPEQPPIEMARP
ncbi:MAG: hypothetical protein R2688_08335 [Fimbriimonadaceae bacterium]